MKIAKEIKNIKDNKSKLPLLVNGHTEEELLIIFLIIL